MPFFAQDSNVRTVVVPTAMIRFPDRLALLRAAAVSGVSSSHSRCMVWFSIVSAFTGSKVPRPTCNVTKCCSIPFFFSFSSSSGVK